MSTFILTLIIGLLILGGLILFSAFFMEHEPSPRQVKNEQQQLSNIEDPQTLIEMAERYEDHEKWQPAINTWSRYIEIQTDGHDGRFRRGVAYHEIGRHEKAIEDLEAVLERVDDPPGQIHLYLARAYRKLENTSRAIDEYRQYLDHHPEDLTVNNEAAEYARENEKSTVAREIYNRMQDVGDSNLYTEATLGLLSMDLDSQTTERAEPRVEELEERLDDGLLNEDQTWEFWYQKARYYELEEQQEQADDLYRKIYRENPDFRDVQEIVEEQIHSLSEDQLIKKMLKMDREDFIEYCEKIVELMGYEVMSADSFNPEEVEITAREEAQMMKVNRVIFAFKKWDGQVGEIPLKEFELKMLEERFDRGFFVCPGGFNHKAQDYQEDSKDLELVGPEQLLNYLREAEKENL